VGGICRDGSSLGSKPDLFAHDPNCVVAIEPRVHRIRRVGKCRFRGAQPLPIGWQCAGAERAIISTRSERLSST
jgi:hypothetical protein